MSKPVEGAWPFKH